MGLARWHLPPVTIDHCLIEQLVEIEVDPHDASLRIRPRSTEPFVYIKPFFDLGLPGAQLVFDRARKMLAETEPSAELNPLQRSTYEAVLRLAATQLETGAVYYPDVREDQTDRSLPPLSDKLIVSDHWVIYGRTRADNPSIEDLARLKEVIGAAESDEALPPAGRRLVLPPKMNQGRTLIWRKSLERDYGAGSERGNQRVPQPNQQQQNPMSRSFSQSHSTRNRSRSFAAWRRATALWFRGAPWHRKNAHHREPHLPLPGNGSAGPRDGTERSSPDGPS
jgi:hypothetical protein